MAPVAATSTHVADGVSVNPIKLASSQTYKDGDSTTASHPRTPLQLSGVLDSFLHHEVTPVIGREYPTIQLKQLLDAPNSDELLRELAIVISRRGVVFFRNQDLTPEEQKQFTDKIGQLAGKPKSSTLHIHPVINSERQADYQALDEKGTTNKDDTISVISSKGRKGLYSGHRTTGADEWHSDITFEPVPSDYTSLKVHTLPPTGGDTLWSSGYEIYDLLSDSFKSFADSLTGRFAQPNFGLAAQKGGFRLHPGPRGSPLNVGEELDALHPFIRTNPVTGWKSVFGVGSHFQEIVDVSKRESEIIKAYVLELVTSSHAAQVRFKWGKNDLAIWDNVSDQILFPSF
jgi:alpha-ketoglutarate-dependent taurine dioxygenase